MAYIEFPTGKYNGAKAIYNVIHYIINPQKNPYGITNAQNVSEEELSHITEHFRNVQKYWRKTNRKRIRHFHVDFPPDCTLSYEDYSYIAYEIIEYFEDYQIIFALHEFDNKGKPCHKHIHFAFNPINYRNGTRYRLDKKELRHLREYIEDILSEYHFTLELQGEIPSEV